MGSGAADIAILQQLAFNLGVCARKKWWVRLKSGKLLISC